MLHTGFWRRNLRERDHFEDPGIDGKIIFRWIFGNWDGGIDWIDLAQYRVRWLALAKAIMNLQDQ